MKNIALSLSFFVLIMSLLSCGNAGYTAKDIDYSVAKSQLNDSITQSICKLLPHYYTIKDALVNDDALSVRKGSIEFSIQLENIIQQYKEEYTTSSKFLLELQYSIKQIRQIDDKSCEKQRVAFERLSVLLLYYFKNIQLKNVPIYIFNSFSAFNEKGARWLSNNNQIYNPYYGKKMLYEGDLVDSIY